MKCWKTPTAEKFRKDIQAPLFAHFLKGNGSDQIPEAMTFQTGSNTWKTYDQWPPVKSTEMKNLYLNANGGLSFEMPKESEGSDEYLSDPFHPVPYRTRPIEMTYGPGSRWYTWLVEDQRFVQNRPDVISWERLWFSDWLIMSTSLVTLERTSPWVQVS